MDQKSIKKKANKEGQQQLDNSESYAPEYYFGVCVSVL